METNLKTKEIMTTTDIFRALFRQNDKNFIDFIYNEQVALYVYIDDKCIEPVAWKYNYNLDEQKEEVKEFVKKYILK